MNRESYEDARALLENIDSESNQARTIEETLYSIMKNGGESKIYVKTKDNKDLTITLYKDDTDIILRDVLKNHNARIYKSKEMLEGIISKQIVKLQN